VAGRTVGGVEARRGRACLVAVQRRVGAGVELRGAVSAAVAAAGAAGAVEGAGRHRGVGARLGAGAAVAAGLGSTFVHVGLAPAACKASFAGADEQAERRGGGVGGAGSAVAAGRRGALVGVDARAVVGADRGRVARLARAVVADRAGLQRDELAAPALRAAAVARALGADAGGGVALVLARAAVRLREREGERSQRRPSEQGRAGQEKLFGQRRWWRVKGGSKENKQLVPARAWTIPRRSRTGTCSRGCGRRRRCGMARCARPAPRPPAPARTSRPAVAAAAAAARPARRRSPSRRSQVRSRSGSGPAAAPGAARAPARSWRPRSPAGSGRRSARGTAIFGRCWSRRGRAGRRGPASARRRTRSTPG